MLRSAFNVMFCSESTRVELFFCTQLSIRKQEEETEKLLPSFPHFYPHCLPPPSPPAFPSPSFIFSPFTSLSLSRSVNSVSTQTDKTVQFTRPHI